MHKYLLELPMRIDAERVYIRSYCSGDGLMYHAAAKRNRAHLQRYESDNALMSITSDEEAEIVVRELAAGWTSRENFFFGVFDRKTDAFNGQVTLIPVSWEIPEFELGAVADCDHEGKGLMTEAVRAAVGFCFTHLQANRLRMRTDPTNVRSIRLAERCGFQKEGLLRDNKRDPDGTCTGTLVYSILKKEFESGLPHAQKRKIGKSAVVALREITTETLGLILKLSKTLPDHQQRMVATNAVSIAEAHFSEKAWFRAVYADEIPVGFVMLHNDSDKGEYFLWRFMIAFPFQGMGFGEKALRLVIDDVKTRPKAKELVTSYVPIEGGPGEFYGKLGFVPTGEIDDGEVVTRLIF